MLQSKKTPKNVLHEWLIELNSQPSIIKRFDDIELEELVTYINEQLQNRFEYIINFLTIKPNYTEEWAFNHISQYGMNYNRLNSLKEFIINRIEELRQIGRFNKEIFKDEPSEIFFKKIVDEWFEKENKLKTALSYVFRMMWVDTHVEYKPKNMTFEIVCDQPKFAEYWNKNYSKIYKFNDETNPRFKTLTEITSNKYLLKLTKILDSYKTGG